MGEVVDMFPNDDADPDRTPLTISDGANGVRWIGVTGPDGELLPFKGVRSPKATRPLTMRDRLIVWDYDADSAAIVRLGAMHYDDLIRASVHYNNEHYGKPGLMAQALGLLWNRAAGQMGGLEPNDPTSTMESLNDSNGHSVLDHRWSPDWE